MATETTVLLPDASGNFSLTQLAKSDIARIDIADVDLIVTDKKGERFLIPNAGMEAMGDNPPIVTFSDGPVSVTQMIGEVGAVINLSFDSDLLSSLKSEGALSTKESDLEKQLEELQKEKEEIEQKLQKQIEEQQAQIQQQQEQKEQQEQQQQEREQSKDGSADTSALTQNTETSVQKLVEEAKKIEENLHRTDYDYNPPHHYQPPPNPSSPPPGVPAPISMTPFVSISMGNVVGTTVVGNSIYGGGGSTGSAAADLIGPRDPLQFSTATISGTAGNDVIYTDGPLVGNADPALDRSLNAKQFLLNVAGYFTQLYDVVVSGVPASVSITGATDNGGGVWTIPATMVADNLPFSLVYDMDAWRGGSNSFDVSIRVTGQSARGMTFDTTQTFRFLYMDVTEVSQITNPTLVYDYRGQTKQVYVLPTMSRPSIINSGDGNDEIHGGRNIDTITAGNGDNQIYAYEGDDAVVTGNGNNTISLGSGNNTSTSGSGNDTVTADDGNNTIDAGDGTNFITVGDGDNSLTTCINGDTIVAGDGANTIVAGDGVNSVTVGNGVNAVTTGAGADTIVTGSGAATINAGDGNNNITTGGGAVNIVTGVGLDTINVNGGGGAISAGDGANIIHVTTGNYTITAGIGNDTVTAGDGNNIIDVGDGTNSVTAGNGNNTIRSGSGNDTLIAGNGNNIFQGGLGTNAITGGTGSNTVDYSVIGTTAVSVNLTTGIVTGVGLNDTLTSIQNVTGTSQADTLLGSAGNNIIRGGDGNDIITGNGGNDTLYGDEGDDTITGGTGNDTIYGGNGNNTIYTGTAGTDAVYGGTGNNTFISQHAGVVYDGTNGGLIGATQVNTIDYSADTAGMTINLLTGYGFGGLANGDIYRATPVSGVNSINSIIAGSGNDTITDSAGNDYINGGGGTNVFYVNNGIDTFVGGAAQDQFIGNGTGTKTYIGNAGNNYYDMGTPAEAVVSGVGWDMIRYYRSTAGVLVNLDTVNHTAVNSLGVTINVAQQSGAGWAATSADSGSYAIGDSFSGDSYDYFWGSGASDVVWDRPAGGMEFDGNSGVDWFFGGAGNSLIRLTDNDRLDGGGGGGDIVYANTNNSVTIYLDGSADINNNGIADSTDRGINLTIAAGASITGSAITYAGFALGYSGTDYLSNIEYMLGEGGNDLLVGNAAANLINGRSGNNSMYGMGGNDTIYSSQGGINIIDGGSGTDTVDFSNSWYTSGTTTAAYVFLADGTFLGGASDKISYIGAGNAAYQAMTAGGTLATITAVENITGSSLNDVLYGAATANTIRGGAGDDIIAGNGGADLLYGEAGNDTFLVTTANLAAVTIFDGGANTDTVRVSGLALTAGSLANAKYNSIEVLDIRNGAGAGNYTINANDITNLADNGINSSLNVRVDTGDVLNITTGAGTGSLSYLVASTTATNTIYWLYSDAAHAVLNTTNRVAILDVYTGTG